MVEFVIQKRKPLMIWEAFMANMLTDDSNCWTDPYDSS